MKKFILSYKGRKFDAKKCGFFGKFRGLMFTRGERACALLFEFGRPTRAKIHSWFVFFPFLVIWLNNKNEEIYKRVIKPFEGPFTINEPFSRIIEIPFNEKYKNMIRFIKTSRR